MSKSFSNDILVFILITLCLFLRATCTPARAQSGDSQAQAGTPVEEVLTPFPDIVLQGKLQCSLKRQVIIPFRGVITGLNVRPGQSVRKGQVLARYKLWPDIAQQLQRQVAAPQIQDLEVALANLDKALIPLEEKRAETESLVKENMAPSQGLVQIEKEIQVQKQTRKVVEERLQSERRLLAESKAYLKDMLGGSLNPLTRSGDASITAPIAGQVVSILSDLREGLELGAGAPAFIIGVMDPMAIHAQIHESDIVNVALGEKAEVTMESVANRTFEATVSRFSLTPLAPGVGDPSYYDIEFTIPNSDYVLKEGFKGEIIFQPSRTAGSSLPKIINPLRIGEMGRSARLLDWRQGRNGNLGYLASKWKSGHHGLLFVGPKSSGQSPAPPSPVLSELL